MIIRQYIWWERIKLLLKGKLKEKVSDPNAVIERQRKKVINIIADQYSDTFFWLYESRLK